MKPTYDELKTELELTKTELESTKTELQSTKAELFSTRELLKKALEQINSLSEEVAKLKAKIDRNSKNSSQPPSTDQKGNTKTPEKKDREKRAGKARSLLPPEKINNFVRCKQENCPHCGSKSITASNQSCEILQQAELPEVEAIFTEYQMQKYTCDECGKNSSASLPKGVPDSAFGPRLMALLATLTGVFHLAKREAIQLIKDMYGIDMGVGSVPNIEERVANALDPIYNRIHRFVIEGKFCKHFDETGWRNSGKRHFVWIATCEDAAFYMIDPTRSSKAFEKLVGKISTNLQAVTDRYAVYNKIGKYHQYCLAHLIREFKGYAERAGPNQEIGLALEKELREVCRIHRHFRQGKLSLEIRNRRLGHRRKKIRFWLEDGFANGSDELSNLCDSLLNEFDKLWTFMKVQGMEPTNNLAERDLRKLVVWRKKSYGTRSNRGKKFVERITTVSQTLRKLGANVLCFIQDVIISFYSKFEVPYISEALGF